MKRPGAGDGPVVDEIVATANIVATRPADSRPAPAGAPRGRVTFVLDGKAIATRSASTGSAKITLPAGAPGTHQLVALYSGSTSDEPSTSATQSWTVAAPVAARASSRVTAKVKALRKRRAEVSVVVRAPAQPTGTVEILTTTPAGRPKVIARRSLGAFAASGAVTSAHVVVRTPALRKGIRQLTVRYLGCDAVNPSAKNAKVRIR